MTDRHSGYIVTLDRDIREDDAEAIVRALRMIKGVLSVEPQISDPMLHIAQERARYDLGRKLLAIIYPEKQ